MTTQDAYDFAVIGAGVVGCALARRLTLDGARVCVIEKSPDILDGASKGNSGILHTGFDAPSGSLEQACIRAGYDEYLEIKDRLGMPLLRTGALVVAWTKEQAGRLDALMDQARANGIDDVERLTDAEIRKREPHLAEGFTGAFLVPREFVIDPWSAPTAYMLQALANGADILRGAEVIGGRFDGEVWSLDTPRQTIRARAVITCAGLYGDRVDELLLGAASFEIRPRKGQFVVFDKSAAGFVNSIILPVPSATTKGVVICPTAYGNVLVGPTAEEQESRSDASVDCETLQALYDTAARLMPALATQPVTATYAGIRPATEEKGYRIQVHAGQRYVSVGGIRSTGLSAALGIARHVAGECGNFAASREPLANPVWPRAPRLAETEPRAWQEAANDGIVCHCELVTRREIEEALSGPLAARSLGGLKRRTRATMGRCQGFYCSAALAEMTQGRFDAPLAKGISGDD